MSMVGRELNDDQWHIANSTRFFGIMESVQFTRRFRCWVKALVPS
jgi:hypothetical protein